MGCVIICASETRLPAWTKWLSRLLIQAHLKFRTGFIKRHLMIFGKWMEDITENLHNFFAKRSLLVNKINNVSLSLNNLLLYFIIMYDYFKL